MATRRVTQEVAAEMARLYVEESRGAPEIAEIMGLGSTTVYRYLDRAGVERRPLEGAGRQRSASMYKHSPEIEAEICAKYESGESMNRLAEEYGYAQASSLKRVLERYDVSIRPRGATYVEIGEEYGREILRRYEKGESASAIADSLGVTFRNVCRYVKACGVKLRKDVAAGEKHGNWKGGRIIQGDYIAVRMLPGSPFWSMAQASGYVLEHRLVMARTLGRSLHSWETVHHIDGDKQNNDLSNLQLRIGKHGRNTAYRCADCGSTNIEPYELDG